MLYIFKDNHKVKTSQPRGFKEHKFLHCLNTCHTESQKGLYLYQKDKLYLFEVNPDDFYVPVDTLTTHGYFTYSVKTYNVRVKVIHPSRNPELTLNVKLKHISQLPLLIKHFSSILQWHFWTY